MGALLALARSAKSLYLFGRRFREELGSGRVAIALLPIFLLLQQTARTFARGLLEQAQARVRAVTCNDCFLEAWEDVWETERGAEEERASERPRKA